MIELIDLARHKGDTLGGIFRVVVSGVPAGLGSHIQWDKRLNARLMMAVSSMQAIKGVEIGLGFRAAGRFGSEVMDEIFSSADGFSRNTNNAGGIEGGISNGMPIVIRAAMKPIPTLKKPLRSVDIVTKEAIEAAYERSDTCAVPAASVIAEAMAALCTADAVLEKFGGDCIDETEEFQCSTRNTSGNSDRLRMMNHSRIIALFLFFAACMAAGSFAVADTTVPIAGFCSPSCLLNGKTSLELGDYEKALVFLTAAHEEMPFLDDYILFWRARAFEGNAEYEKSLEDIRTIKAAFPDSPLIKSARLREIELAQKTGEKDIDDLFRKFVADYPSESKAKFAYAAYLKYNGSTDKAKTLFKELYLSVTPFSKSSGEELSPSDIRASDL